MSRVSLSAKHARALVAYLCDGDSLFAGNALQAAKAIEKDLAPRPKSSQVRKTAAKRRAKRTETSAIYEEVRTRADSGCEACGKFAGFTGQLDHFFGRARANSVESCWFLCFGCHNSKTLNVPDQGYWLALFIEHCNLHGYSAEREKAVARLEGMLSVRGGR